MAKKIQGVQGVRKVRRVSRKAARFVKSKASATSACNQRGIEMRRGWKARSYSAPFSTKRQAARSSVEGLLSNGRIAYENMLLEYETLKSMIGTGIDEVDDILIRQIKNGNTSSLQYEAAHWFIYSVDDGSGANEIFSLLASSHRRRVKRLINQYQTTRADFESVLQVIGGFVTQLSQGVDCLEESSADILSWMDNPAKTALGFCQEVDGMGYLTDRVQFFRARETVSGQGWNAWNEPCDTFEKPNGDSTNWPPMGSDSYEGRGSLSSLGHSAYPQWKACRKTNPTHYDCGKYKGSEIRGCIQHMTGVLPESVKALMNDSGGELSRLFSSSKRLLGTLKRLLSEISSSLSSIIGVLTSGATTVTLTAAVAAGTVLAATGVGIPVAVAALGLLELRDKATDGLRAARTGVNSAVSMVIQSVAQHAEAKNQWLHGSWRAPVIVAIDEIIAIGEAAQTPWTLPSTKTACSAIYPRISISCLDTLIPSTCVIPIVSVAGITKRIDPSDIFLPRTPGLFDSEGGGGALTIEGFGGIKESRVWGLKPWQAILLGAGVFLFLSNKRDG